MICRYGSSSNKTFNSFYSVLTEHKIAIPRRPILKFM